MTARPGTSPVMLDEIVALLAPALHGRPGAGGLHPRAGRARRGPAGRLPRGPADRAGPRSRRPWPWPPSGWPRTPTGPPWSRRSTTSCRRCWPGSAGREVQGILLDLGLSSLQIDDRARGFAYAVDAPLDMRMGRQELTAATVLNTYSRAELARVLRRYGEERFADRIAARIVDEREREPFTTSARLVRLLHAAIPAAARSTRRPPGQADLPGPADRGERRARRPGVGAAQRGRRPRGGRPDRRAGVPLAGGPAGQAGARRSAPTTGRRGTCPWCRPGCSPSCGC